MNVNKTLKFEWQLKAYGSGEKNKAVRWFVYLNLKLQYVFLLTIALRGYHIYKRTSWSKAKVDNKVLIELEMKIEPLNIDLYICMVKIKNKYFDDLITVGNIPWEISMYISLLK